MYSVRQSASGSYFLQHPRQPGLAWSHEGNGWVRHSDGKAIESFTVITFSDEETADDYATDENLYPRRD